MCIRDSCEAMRCRRSGGAKATEKRSQACLLRPTSLPSRGFHSCVHNCALLNCTPLLLLCTLYQSSLPRTSFPSWAVLSELMGTP